MFIYIIIISLLLWLAYTQQQLQADNKTIIHNQQTLWLMMDNIKQTSDLQLIPIDELTAKTHKLETPDSYPKPDSYYGKGE